VAVAAEVAVVAAAAVAAVLVLPKGQTVAARPAADVVSALLLPTRNTYYVYQVCFHSAALLLQAAGLLLSFCICTTYWTEPLCSTHAQLQECQLPFLILSKGNKHHEPIAAPGSLSC
jgi:hypothetical protein